MNDYSFLDPDRQHENATSLEASELDVLQRYGSCGLAWAKSAVREASSSAIEQPSLVTTQALECLQLYWFGIGNFQSCSLCLCKPLSIEWGILIPVLLIANLHCGIYSSRLSFMPPPWIQSKAK
ncbi:unnamed protein product [Aspergillus oryzae]|uniref:Unnamed protein product n=1 Tax=Aspergillus oryzae TaxID=5062 RepID=A0AAN5BSM7_ASPOZ|nr:unnamed protein product [Aspergillus oryzae]GMF84162.1 unnamed protein product [Aspergillus oryzae]GMG01657.1 unnamed protein product [Aspergillus oryzae]GMG30769.1 unnamed protein product [Aspergillus oryzae]